MHPGDGDKSMIPRSAYCICKLCQWGKGTPLSKKIVKLIVKIQKKKKDFYSDNDK